MILKEGKNFWKKKIVLIGEIIFISSLAFIILFYQFFIKIKRNFYQKFKFANNKRKETQRKKWIIAKISEENFSSFFHFSKIRTIFHSFLRNLFFDKNFLIVFIVFYFVLHDSIFFYNDLKINNFKIF